MIDDDARCPCGTGENYGACCGRFHRGRSAPTAELLMRSRYSAFAAGDEEYLLATWHPGTRPASVALDPQLRWYRLDVHAADGGGPFESEGRVEFSAHWRDGSGARGRQRERSRFVREDGRWFYVDGTPA
ncbi:zinc-binding protein [Kocuria sp. CNJ-770]|uniref:YchJ family protein n=1 Tax=Kocuria sp. CNJ-770 TaxID=1904964 RepID=UPI0009605C76|nr:YchJ family protein [Kocuria sp. CNJ-770]OLT07186.1 zinc-binding protein [Kocuria sp. CNJ-770]